MSRERIGYQRKQLVDRRFKVTPQTAYHITEIALRENIPEGKVIDKLMRTYLASREMDYPRR